MTHSSPEAQDAAKAALAAKIESTRATLAELESAA